MGTVGVLLILLVALFFRSVSLVPYGIDSWFWFVFSRDVSITFFFYDVETNICLVFEGYNYFPDFNFFTRKIMKFQLD